MPNTSKSAKKSKDVNIYVTAYGDESIFELSLDSYLRQSYEKLKIHIFDDGYAVGIHSIRDLVKKKRDSRIIYSANPIRFGTPGNDIQMLGQVNPTAKAVILAADMGLADNALAELMSCAVKSSSQVVMPSGQSHDYSNCTIGGSLPFGPKLRDHIKYSDEECTVDCGQILDKYFGEENARGEFSAFCLFGALIDGALIATFESGYKRFSFHGFEQYLSMLLALSANSVTFTPEPLIRDIVGQPRLGGHYRPIDAISRFECLQGCEDFLQRNYFILRYKGIDVDRLRVGLAGNANFFLSNYKGYKAPVSKILKSNLDLLQLGSP